jgi:malate dehydrogenase (oxaloacetate-decarboxylating)(NADP+)
MIRKRDALEYHSQGRKGKIEVIPTKPCTTARDLSLAYTPGVADPCLEIAREPDLAYEYTAKGNLVAVVTNGTAVLGLGNIGALAGKPVMEGKGILFKRFADIDVFDIELNANTAEEVIQVVKALEPTFGGINLEDIKAPECFVIEEKLKEIMSIPVFHDDQHGTAIIGAAAFLNACELQHKDPKKVKIVISGAGAAAIAMANLLMDLGVPREAFFLCDSQGVVYEGRTSGINEYKAKFIQNTKDRTLADVMRGADVFLGVSSAGLVTKEMVASMADKPIIFAMANPVPEISYPDAISVRSDLVMATGRSDYPNQVNNVLGFPFIFRGALDVRARQINTEMKLAAVRALAALAREDVPDSVSAAYGGQKFKFGPEYIIPKPFDSRVLLWVAPAVAQAAIDSGVARLPLNMDTYLEKLEGLLGRSREVMRKIINRAKLDPIRIIFPEGSNEKILRACQVILDEGIAKPILLGEESELRKKIDELGLDLSEAEIIRPREHPQGEEFIRKYYEERQRKGMTMYQATRTLRHDYNTFAMMMVKEGLADGVISGIEANYPDVIRPALQVFGTAPGVKRVAGMYMLILKNDVKFFADTTVNINPDAEALSEIATNCADMMARLGIEPRIAMISYSNFGETRNADTEKVAHATALIKKRRPDLMVDGEMQIDAAVVPEARETSFPFSSLKGEANLLIFPDLSSGNVAYKLMWRLGGAEAVGPILVGMAKPVNVLQRDCSVDQVVNIAAITALKAKGALEG